MLLQDYVARTIWQQPDLLLHQLPPTSKSRYLAILRALRRCPQLLLMAPMENLLMGLNDSARKKVMKRRHRWMRIVTCQWKHHQMRIRLTRLQEASTSRPGEVVEGAERKKKKLTKGKVLTLAASKFATQCVLGFLHPFLSQKALVAETGQRNSLPTRAR